MLDLIVIVALVVLIAGVALAIELLRADAHSPLRRWFRRPRPYDAGDVQPRRDAAPPTAAKKAAAGSPAWSEVGASDWTDGQRRERRRLLWRDSAIVLFAVCAVVLIAAAMLPGNGNPAPSDTAPSGGPSSSLGAVAGATATPASSDGSASPSTSDPSGAPPPTQGPSATPTAPPSATPGSTPRPTPEPTPTPTAAPTPTPTPGPDAPVAVIRQDVDCITVAGFVRFDGRDSEREREYLWDFGDGTTSNRPAPLHAYALIPNVYTVTLTVTGKGGQDTATSTVTVPCPPP